MDIRFVNVFFLLIRCSTLHPFFFLMRCTTLHPYIHTHARTHTHTHTHIVSVCVSVRLCRVCVSVRLYRLAAMGRCVCVSCCLRLCLCITDLLFEFVCVFVCVCVCVCVCICPRVSAVCCVWLFSPPPLVLFPSLPFSHALLDTRALSRSIHLLSKKKREKKRTYPSIQLPHTHSSLLLLSLYILSLSSLYPFTLSALYHTLRGSMPRHTRAALYGC